MTAPEEPSKEQNDDPPFQLSGAWLVCGLLAVALGIMCGLIMSGATLVR